MARKRRLLRLVALALAVCVFLPGKAAGETIQEAEARQEELRKENEELNQKLDALRADEEKVLEYQAALQEKIILTKKKIDASRSSIKLMDQEISMLEQKLSASKSEYQNTLDLFAQRIRSLYMAGGSIGTLEILLNSNSFSDFSMRTEMVSAVTRHDQLLLEKIEEYLDKTGEDRVTMQSLRSKEAQVKKELESAQDELEKLLAENSALLAELREKRGEIESTIAANEEEDAELEDRIQELIKQQNQHSSLITPSNPGWHDDFYPCWPLPGVGLGNITGHFGDMYYNGPHHGMDIGADYGTPIIATQAGQVLSAEYHWSWGNNVLIWHNENFATRYAHMCELAVSAGEYVEQGDIIGYVGDTGESFGDHLHYEVYLNGTRVAPEPYLGLW